MPVESARSQNITVACRRSPTASGIGRPGLCGNGSGAGATATADFSLASKFKIALSSRIRCPNGMPSFTRWGSVSSGRKHQCRSHSRGTPLHTDQGQGLGATPRHQWWVPCWSWLMIVQGRQPVQVSLLVNILQAVFCGNGRIALGESDRVVFSREQPKAAQPKKLTSGRY
jgi:hypothetical protein